MKLDMATITAFLALCDSGSSYAAARLLGVSQPALSRRIQRLEAEAGVSLFRKMGRGLQLTEAGERLLPQVRMHVTGLQGAFNQLREQNTYGLPNVCIGCLQSLAMRWLPGIIAAYSEKEGELRLRILDLSATEIDNRVMQGDADFGVNSLAGSTLLQQQTIGQDPLVYVVSKNAPLADRMFVKWSDLEGTPLISIGPTSGNRLLINHYYEHINARLSWQHEVQHIATSMTFAAAGVAGTIIPLLSADRFNDAVKIIPVVEPVISRRIGIVMRRGEQLSPAAENLRRTIAASLKKLLKDRIAELPERIEKSARL